MKPLIPAILSAFVALSAHAAEPIVIANFEGDTYGDWKPNGDAFGAGPAHGGLINPWRSDLTKPVTGFMGKGFASSYYLGDGGTGSLTSPEFKIERKYITFLIGGSQDVERVCLNLLVGGKVVRVAGASKDLPEGTETLAPGSWDVEEFAGKSAIIQITDNSGDQGKGHINVDQIVLTDVKPAPTDPKSPQLQLFVNAKRDFKIEKRYLNIPIKNGVPARPVTTLVDGKLAVRNDIGLADDTPDWWAFMDVSDWNGKTVTLEVEKMVAGSKFLDSIEQSDTIKDSANLYSEPLRAQLHFSSRRGWNNDPNGMVFSQGEYHLYYQLNPYGWGWGNMHWGHAVSSDMVHWKELPIGIYPHAPGDAVFSGSAIVDKANTSGWKTGADDLLVAAFTSTGRGECIVYSNDKGRTFTDFEGNPVVKHGGRDPRLLWHAPSKQWVMAVYDEGTGKQCVAFYTSPDLKTWTFQSRIEGFYECPDFFELPVDGVATNKKWVLTAASSDYMIGTFDGKTFTPETPKLKGHQGGGFYAAQTFSHDPKGRTIQIGWLQHATFGMPFNQAMSLPNQLTLRSTPEGPRLAWTPVDELKSLRAKSIDCKALTLAPDAPNPLAKASGELLELRATFTPPAKGEVKFTLRGIPIIYNSEQHTLAVGGHNVAAPLRDGKIDLTVFTDRNTYEVFTAGGLAYVPLPITPNPTALGAEVAVTGGNVTFQQLEVHELKSIWAKH